MGSWQQTRIAVIGCGGLGVPGAWALLAGGVEKLLLVDNDVVDASNLHRQVLYPEATVGEPKADVLPRRTGEHRADAERLRRGP